MHVNLKELRCAVNLISDHIEGKINDTTVSGEYLCIGIIAYKNCIKTFGSRYCIRLSLIDSTSFMNDYRVKYDFDFGDLNEEEIKSLILLSKLNIRKFLEYFVITKTLNDNFELNIISELTK